jgi:predicted AAA+ superfamily ATPase
MNRRTDIINPQLLVAKRDLDIFLDRYLLCGGIPRAINDYEMNGSISSRTFDTYLEALRNDLAHWNKDNNTAEELVSKLVGSISCPVSWLELAKAIGIRQPTVKNYIWTMEHCFVITYINHTTNLLKPKADTLKNKKVYFVDPFIFHAIRYWVTSSGTSSPFELAMEFLKDPSRKGMMVENIVENHLVRLLFNLNPHSGFEPNKDLFYANVERRREVDFILNLRPKPVPIEVKYQSSVSKKDLDPVNRVASKTGTRGILVSKEDVHIDEASMILPASLFLFLI